MRSRSYLLFTFFFTPPHSLGVSTCMISFEKSCYIIVFVQHWCQVNDCLHNKLEQFLCDRSSFFIRHTHYLKLLCFNHGNWKQKTIIALFGVLYMNLNLLSTSSENFIYVNWFLLILAPFRISLMTIVFMIKFHWTVFYTYYNRKCGQ